MRISTCNWRRHLKLQRKQSRVQQMFFQGFLLFFSPAMGVRSGSRTSYHNQLVTSEDGRDICYGLPAYTAVVSATLELPACVDSSPLPAYRGTPSFFTQLWRFFRKSEQRQHCRALSRGWLGTSSLLVLLRCCTTSGPFLSFWQFIFPSIYCRKAFRGVLCFSQKVFISRKLQVSTLQDWRGVGAHAYCSYIPDLFILHACTEVTFYCQFQGRLGLGLSCSIQTLKSKMHMP